MEALLALLALILGEDHALVVALRAVEPSDDPARPLANIPDEGEHSLDAVRAALTDAADDEELDTDTVVAIADALDAVREEDTARETEAEADAKAREEALRRIRAEAGENGDGDGDDGDEDDGDEEDDGDADADADAEDKAKEPILASGKARRPSIGRVAARRPARQAPAPAAQVSSGTLTILHDTADSSFERGQRFESIDDLSVAFAKLLDDNAGGGKFGSPERRLARISIDYPDDRVLSNSDLDASTRKIRAAIQKTREAVAAAAPGGGKVKALTASGGLCAPRTPYYAKPNVGDDGRPVRSALPSFRADRGGITLVPPKSLVDGYTGGVSVWTAANDANPENPSVKPCLVIDCEEQVQTDILAVTECAQVGEFRTRTDPEAVAELLHNLGLQHARTAERAIVDVFEDPANSEDLGAAPARLGVSRDLFWYLDLMVPRFRTARRMDRNSPIDVYLPERLISAIRADRLSELPGSTDEVFAITEAWLDRNFAARNLRPTWMRDEEIESDDVAPAFALWPTSQRIFFHHPGAFLFLEAGMLNLGIGGGDPIRDSGLVETNDMRLFAETFEGTAYVGVGSKFFDLEICVSGASAGTIDPTTLCGETGPNT